MSGRQGTALRGTLVIDASRMLPGAVLARMLLDLGARLIKVEEPRAGDPLRALPPQVEGIGAGFCTFFRGAESVALDLRQPRGAAALAGLTRRADVFVESFRPGTLQGWGLGRDRLAADNPRLVVCSLPAHASGGPYAERVGHDLNFVASTGLLSRLGGAAPPGVQAADVTAGLLACSAVLAALLEREHSGRGRRVEQPLSAAPLPFLTLAWAEAAAGGASGSDTLLCSGVPAYRTYRCADNRSLAVGALEPKFWISFCEMLGRPDLGTLGLAVGTAGAAASEQVGSVLAAHPRDHWLALAAARNLPVSPVQSLEQARRDDAHVRDGSGFERTPAPGGRTLETPAPFLPSLGATPSVSAPRLGQHTEPVLAEFGVG